MSHGGGGGGGGFAKQMRPLAKGSHPQPPSAVQHGVVPAGGVHSLPSTRIFSPSRLHSLEAGESGFGKHVRPTPVGSMPQSAVGVQQGMPAAGFGHSDGLHTPGVGLTVDPPSGPLLPVLDEEGAWSSHAAAATSPKAMRISNRFTGGLLAWSAYGQSGGA